MISARHKSIAAAALVAATASLLGVPATAATGCTTQARYLVDDKGEIPNYVIPTGVSRSGYAVGRVSGDGASFITPDAGEDFTVFTTLRVGDSRIVDPTDVNNRGQSVGTTEDTRGSTVAKGWSYRDGRLHILRSSSKKDAQPYDINNAGMIGGQANGKAAFWKSWKAAPAFLPTRGMTDGKVRFLSPTGTFALGTAVGGSTLDPVTYLIRWKHGKVVAKQPLPLGFRIDNFWGTDAFNKSSVVGSIARSGSSSIPIRVSVYDGVLRYDTRFPDLHSFIPDALSGKAVAGSAEYNPDGPGTAPVRSGVVIAPDGSVHWLANATKITHLDGDTALGQDADENIIVFSCVFAAPTTPGDPL